MSYGNKGIDDWANAVNAWAERKGWNDIPASHAEQIALMHSELSEALEAYRIGRLETELSIASPDSRAKPEGMYSELADCVIRIMHHCARNGVSLEREIALKMAYNEYRPYRHGDKAI